MTYTYEFDVKPRVPSRFGEYVAALGDDELEECLGRVKHDMDNAKLSIELHATLLEEALGEEVTAKRKYALVMEEIDGRK